MQISDKKPACLKGVAKPFVIALLLAGIAGYSVLRCLWLQQDVLVLRAGLRQEQAALKDVFTTAQKQQEDFSAQIKAQVESIAQLRSSLQQEDLKVSGLEAALENKKGEYSLLAAKLGDMAAFLLARAEPDAGAEAALPLPFSYFRGEEWAARVAAVKAKESAAHIAGGVIDGGGGNDIMNDARGGDKFLDGLNLIGIENYVFVNGKPDTVTILAPGLLHLDKDTMSIEGDRDMDRVVLDGCLVWKSSVRPKGVMAWKATDKNGETKTVEISPGVATKVQDKCDHRYLDRRELKAFAATLKASKEPAAEQAMHAPAPFGGVGLVLGQVEGGGIKVVRALPGKPAQKAGLNASDIVTGIDGTPVSDMSLPGAIARMRGPAGTSVRLTYLPAGQAAGSAKDATLTREPIDLSSGGEAKPGAYPSVEEIPFPLRQKISGFGNRQYKEQYTNAVLSLLRQSGRVDGVLDREDIETLKKKETERRRHQQVAESMRYDRNFDGKVTREEVRATLSDEQNGARRESNGEFIDRQTDNIMKTDANGDGVLTLEEMGTLRKNRDYNADRYAELEGLLSLDPDKDGKVTAAELELIALKAFRTVDADDDGVLSAEEIKSVAAANNEDRRRLMEERKKQFDRP